GQATPGTENRSPSNLARSLSAIASGVFVITAIAALPPLGATAVLLAYAWLLVAADAIHDKLGLLTQAGAILALTAAKWAAADTAAPDGVDDALDHRRRRLPRVACPPRPRRPRARLVARVRLVPRRRAGGQVLRARHARLVARRSRHRRDAAAERADVHGPR